MDWAGIPLVAEILGYDDMELLITQLSHIRSHMIRSHMNQRAG